MEHNGGEETRLPSRLARRRVAAARSAKLMAERVAEREKRQAIKAAERLKQWQKEDHEAASSSLGSSDESSSDECVAHPRGIIRRTVFGDDDDGMFGDDDVSDGWNENPVRVKQEEDDVPMALSDIEAAVQQPDEEVAEVVAEVVEEEGAPVEFWRLFTGDRFLNLKREREAEDELLRQLEIEMAQDMEATQETVPGTGVLSRSEDETALHWSLKRVFDMIDSHGEGDLSGFWDQPVVLVALRTVQCPVPAEVMQIIPDQEVVYLQDVVQAFRKVSVDEGMSLLRQLERLWQGVQAREVFHRLDTSGDGLVDLQELIDGGIAKGMGEGEITDLKAMFIEMDADPVSYTHLRAHETPEHLVCRLLLEKKKKSKLTAYFNFKRKYTKNIIKHNIVTY
eukprot:TRINITY_DN7651_c0_g3_i1.p1 TRINITY_DN7651_c0_g3~~TRINITY_DN7651_c0_g3_i1.p1  ORF type:complete len:395 (-),score=134.69 TRINITY_DN7651_c0_g3_i1:25-1209(-)